MRAPAAVLALTVLLAGALAAGEEEQRDRILYRDGKKRDCWIEKETADEVDYRNERGGPSVLKLKTSQAKEFQYAFMLQASYWTKGSEARERGRYEESAEQFNALASSGQREAEKFHGAFEEGASWELAGKFDKAAKAFKAAADGFPAYRLNLDARCRLGMALAQAGDKAAAEAVVAKLEADGKATPMGGMANSKRANAIRAAIAAAENQPGKLREYLGKAAFSQADEPGAWLHLNLWAADTLVRMGKAQDAANLYGRMQAMLGDNPAALARVGLGLGLAKLESDRQAALIEFLRLDTLPYGSAEQKTQARLQAARILLAEAAALKKDATAMKDERKAAFVAEQERAARVLLAAAAEAVTDHPAKAEAKAELDKLPSDEPPKPAAPATTTPAASATPAKPATGAAPAPAPAKPATAAPAAK